MEQVYTLQIIYVKITKMHDNTKLLSSQYQWCLIFSKNLEHS